MIEKFKKESAGEIDTGNPGPDPWPRPGFERVCLYL
jgi:hypothetical protein